MPAEPAAAADIKPQPAESVLQKLWRVLLPFLPLVAVSLFFVVAEFGKQRLEYSSEQAELQQQIEAAQGAGDTAEAERLQERQRSFSYRSTFLTQRNARNILIQGVTVAVAALGMTLIIISGGIDLSAGTALSLSATVLAWCFINDYSGWVAVPACIACGVMAGLLNGAVISLMRMIPFIVTLGTMSLYLGLGKWIADGTTIQPNLAEQVPEWVRALVDPVRTPDWMVLPAGVWLLFILSLLLAAVLRWSVFSRHVFAIGSNEATARLCGINVPRTKILVYALAGLFTGIAGILMFSRIKVGTPTDGIGMELKVIAAVVIGGGSLNGGRGTVLGTLLGAFTMQVLSSGSSTMEWDNEIQDMLIGAIIIAAVALDKFRQRVEG